MGVTTLAENLLISFDSNAASSTQTKNIPENLAEAEIRYSGNNAVADDSLAGFDEFNNVMRRTSNVSSSVKALKL